MHRHEPGVGQRCSAVRRRRRARGDRPRWLCITDSGHDLSDEPDDDAFHRRLEELRVAQGRADWDLPYTPNWVSPVTLGRYGPELAADCKGEMSPEMARTVLSVLLEALERAGVQEASVRTTGPGCGLGPVLAEIYP